MVEERDDTTAGRPREAIRVRGLGKRYRIGSRQPYRRLTEALNRKARSLGRRGRADAGKSGVETLWALKDVSFDVGEGEIIGVIGPNGAGKTTLLKILSRIVKPTEGWAEIHGRVGSMLEVGTGFHPDLTGRENVMLNGVILGMTRGEVEEKYEDIVRFSELWKFMETPVKHYSSGMYVRLAFAVAAHLEPEILLVDEVLAVGDQSFQRKCLGKMREVAEGGRTVFFVSHGLGTVTELCGRVLWIDDGRLRMDGPPRDVVQEYLSKGAEEDVRWGHPVDLECGRRMRVEKVELMGEGPLTHPSVPFDQPVRIVLESQVERLTPDGAMGIRITDATGATVFTSLDTDTGRQGDGPRRPGRYRSSCTVPPRLLRPGRYWLSVFSITPGPWGADRHENILTFEVSQLGYRFDPERRGIIAPVLDWSVEALG